MNPNTKAKMFWFKRSSNLLILMLTFFFLKKILLKLLSVMSLHFQIDTGLFFALYCCLNIKLQIYVHSPYYLYFHHLKYFVFVSNGGMLPQSLNKLSQI